MARAGYYDHDMDWMIYMPASIEVIEDSCVATATGLLNAEGLRIMRAPERVPFGFQPSVGNTAH